MAVQYHTVTEHEAGQRVDNFLIRYFKQVPKSAIYRILRKGEVRVDKKRVQPEKKLELGEIIRIPPVKLDLENKPQDKPAVASQALLDTLEKAVLREDEQLIFINKPSGLPVHGGSGYKLGLIEAFRQLRPNLPYVELAHRIDRDTSGVVILAKSRQALTELHELFRTGNIDKRYLALVAGRWKHGRQHVTMDLSKEEGTRQKVQVVEDGEGKESETIFAPVKNLHGASLIEAQILTGRMHQIRVQLQNMGHPVLGDDRYGDFALNRQFREKGLKRLFLHSASVNLVLFLTGRRYIVEAPLPADLQAVVANLK
jgi:23S rRNA pseudouridine955/2504/2580 synthase